MARIIADRILETSTTIGTGAYTLAGAVTGFRAASSVCANADTIEYYAENVDSAGRPTGDWETGLGTWGTGNTLTRSVIYASSNSGSAVSWVAGTRRIALSLTALGLTSSFASILRANHNISGGGTITVDASSNVIWSSRFIVISNGRGLNGSGSGYFDITCPTSGTITGVGGATDVTATAAGIPIGAWQALYYILPVGSNNTSVAANFRISGYTSDVNIPYDWVLICVRNADDGRIYFPRGLSIAPGNSASYASSFVNNATLTLNVSGTGLSGSQTFSANQSTAATFTVTSNATSANTASTIVARDASGNFAAGTVSANTTGRLINLSADGVPTSNLGSPTVPEMALFDAQFNNKTELYDITNVFVESSTDGTTWTTFSVTDTQKRTLLTGDGSSSIVIPYNTAYFRVRFRATSYVYLNALYTYFSSQGHQTKVQTYKKHDSGTYTQHTGSTALVSGWPGHIYLPFPTIPFHNAGTLGTHYHETSIVFIPTWNATYPSNGIALYKMQLWGGYPAGKRNLYSTDELGNATFPAGITASTNMTVTNLLAVGQTPSTDRGLFVRPTALTGTIQYGSVSSIVSTSGATSLVAGLFADARTSVAAYTVSTLAAAYIGNAVKGAGSTITSQHGIYIEDQTQGGNNYGITSLVSSGTNKWNIYASGTANNYFAGKAVFGHTSTANTGQINVLGTVRVVDASTETNALLTTVTATTSTIETRYATPLIFGTGAIERMRIDSTGLGIGTSSPGYKLDVSGDIRANTSSTNYIYAYNSTAATSGSSQSSPRVGFYGAEWNSGTGSVAMTAYLQLQTLSNNVASPTSKLSVYVGANGGAAAETAYFGSNGNLVNYGDLSLTNTTAATTGSAPSSYKQYFYRNSWNSTTGSNLQTSYIYAKNITNNANPTVEAIVIAPSDGATSSAGNEAFFFTGTGNLGIGTSSPQAKVHATGNIATSIQGYNGPTTFIGTIIGSADASLPDVDLRRWLGTATDHATARIKLDLSSNLSIHVDTKTTNTYATTELLRLNDSTGVSILGGKPLVFYGATSGTISLSPTAVAGTTTLTLPATTGTLALTSQIPTVNDATLTLNVSGTGLSGSQTFTANQASAATFTVSSNATNANTASTIVARDASGNFSAGTITATLSGNASTATTLATARNIGDVSFNGSAAIVPERILYKDTRATDFAPFAYPGVTLHLKTNTTDSLADGGTYHGVLSLQHWSDSSGGLHHQLGLTDSNNLYIRSSSGASWGTWAKVWHDGNLTNLNQLTNGPGYTTNTGTVTSVSVTSANGFAGSVATNTTTPAITISTSVTGILYGNGTSVAAAVAGNFPTLNQSTTGNAATATTATNQSGGTVSATSANANYIGVNNTTSTNGYGVSLYNGAVAGQPTYGLMFQGTATFGTHGSVTADWATYFTMNTTANRGWVFKAGSGSAGNVASIDVAGTAVFNGNVTAYSDARLKTNIEVITGAVEKVKQVRGVTYTRTDSGDRQTGVIAQELLKVLPEAVIGTEETTYSVAYGNIVGLLIEAIKEQQNTIDSQEERISRLEALIVSKL